MAIKVLSTRQAKPKIKESTIQKNIIAFLRSKGYLVVRVNGGAMTGGISGKRRYVVSYYAYTNGGAMTAGHPDLVAYKGNQVLFLEVKTATGRLSPKQKEFHKAINEHGGKCHVVRSVADVAKVLLEES